MRCKHTLGQCETFHKDSLRCLHSASHLLPAPSGNLPKRRFATSRVFNVFRSRSSGDVSKGHSKIIEFFQLLGTLQVGPAPPRASRTQVPWRERGPVPPDHGFLCGLTIWRTGANGEAHAFPRRDLFSLQRVGGRGLSETCPKLSRGEANSLGNTAHARWQTGGPCPLSNPGLGVS